MPSPWGPAQRRFEQRRVRLNRRRLILGWAKDIVILVIVVAGFALGCGMAIQSGRGTPPPMEGSFE